MTEILNKEEMITCPIDLLPYDNQNRKPIVFFPCGHTICLECKPKLKNNKCPFDNSAISNTAINYVVLSNLSSSDVQKEINKKEDISSAASAQDNSDDYIWLWLYNNLEHYEPYKTDIQNLITQGYRNYRNDNSKNILNLNLTASCSYFIDFSKMKQINNTTNYERQIKRILKTRFKWKYYDNNSDDWIEFDESLQDQLETNYFKYINNNDTSIFEFKKLNQSDDYLIDFSSLLETNLNTYKSTNIKRSI